MDKRTEPQPQRNADIKKLHERLRGGHVMRYHTRPELADGQNVAAHTWRAMVILDTLWPDSSRNAMRYMLYHDVAEAELGDMPATTKWGYPAINAEMIKAEQEYEEKIGVKTQVYEKEHAMCDISDKLELVLHCYRLMQQGNGLAEDVFYKGVNYLRQKYSQNPVFLPAKGVLDELTAKKNQKPEHISSILRRLCHV